MFEAFPKMGRLYREIVVTEKIDGTNAQILIEALSQENDTPFDGLEVQHNGGRYGIKAGSRSRWITPDKDNFGFARWVYENAAMLCRLGPGRHFGEWWGAGIQRRYNQESKRFSLFNSSRWNEENTPDCVSVVPELYRGVFSEEAIQSVMTDLATNGSRAAPGFMDPEGIIVYHTAADVGFKYTLGGDGHKGG